MLFLWKDEGGKTNKPTNHHQQQKEANKPNETTVGTCRKNVAFQTSKHHDPRGVLGVCQGEAGCGWTGSTC